MRLLFSFAAIEINEAAGFDDFLFFLVKGQDIKGNGFCHAIFQDIGGISSMDPARYFLDGRNKNEIVYIKGNRLIFQMKGQHPPVDDVAAIPFGRIFTSDVGKAADDALTAGCLFTSTAITRFIGVNDRTDFRIGKSNIFTARNGVDGGKSSCHIGILLQEVFAFFTGKFQFLDRFGPPHILRITARQGKFGKPQWIGTIGGCFPGRNKFIRRRYRVFNLGTDAQENIVP